MISADYLKYGNMTEDMSTIVGRMWMDVRETTDEFIFSILNEYAMDNFCMVLQKEELVCAIRLIQMCKEHDVKIDECLSMTAHKTADLSDSYRRGFQDGVNSEHARIMDIVEKEIKNN